MFAIALFATHTVALIAVKQRLLVRPGQAMHSWRISRDQKKTTLDNKTKSIIDQ
jgi:hypothetical protein